MIEQLPYELTNGVTATREGLQISYKCQILYLYADLMFFPRWSDLIDDRLILWPDAAERLRYREGDNWAQLMNNHIVIESGKFDPFSDLPVLHRIAAILCDDADAFRVLHWCVHNLT